MRHASSLVGEDGRRGVDPDGAVHHGRGGLRPRRIGWPQMDVSPIGRIQDHSVFLQPFKGPAAISVNPQGVPCVALR
ncbi:hypothetical protein AJ87_23895 [Rhizobium yanglingense]|nr:hypothetical protein AJ87_23895 [Rhizobium yanglingense]